MAQNEELGRVGEAQLSTGRIRYRERGEGPVVVFVHGLLVNGDLWRKVVPAIADAGYRCVVPDWPLGSHEVAVPDADLSPPGVAALIAEFLEVMQLQEVTVVANDTGGAITQLLMVNHPERIRAVVLTPSDCFERFFPPAFAPLPRLARVPGLVWALTQVVRWRALQRLPVTFGWVAKRPIPPAVVDSYLRPSRSDPAIRADLRRFLVGVHKRHTLAAAERLGDFDRPVLLAWASEEKLFPLSLAHRLQRILPNAQLEVVDDSYTFVAEDQPEALARVVVDFLGVHAAS